MYADHSSKIVKVHVSLFVTIICNKITSVDVRFKDKTLPKSLVDLWMHSLTFGIPAKRVDLICRDRSFFIKHGATIMPAKFKYKARDQTGSVFEENRDPRA